MELAPVGVSLTFEVTFDSNSLNVAMSVYDTSSTNPVLLQGPTAMTSIVGNTYIGKFTPPLTRPYMILKAVYTDNTFATLSPNYAQGTESIIAQTISGGGGGGSTTGCYLVGLVIPNPVIIGFVAC